MDHPCATWRGCVGTAAMHPWSVHSEWKRQAWTIAAVWGIRDPTWDRKRTANGTVGAPSRPMGTWCGDSSADELEGMRQAMRNW